MFEEHREKKAAKEHADAVVAWRARRDAQAALLDTARTSTGTGADSLLLQAGEAVFAQVTEAALVEERRGAGHYQGSSQGVSIPVASIGGRSVRYRVGANRGHYVQGTPAPTAIDHGTVYVTNRRVIFQGGAQTRECAFAKLIGFEHDDASGSTTFSVSNRQKPTTIHYGPKIAAWFDFRLDLALAHFRGTVDELIAGLQQDLDEIDRHRPPDLDQVASAPVAPPAPVEAVPPGDVAATSATPVAMAATTAGWYADPWRQAAYRWWNGARWTADLHDATPPA